MPKAFKITLTFTSNNPESEPEHYLETAVEYEPHQLTALDIDNFGEVATTALKHNLKRRGLLQEESHATRQNN
ncbi:hypothetical protein SEA_PSONYX_93 [Corynebacterium phage PSonyx]|nr:hypothetical protein SEA_PSONYX_93 [Corynebacterium phage PSonyx]